MFILGFTTAVIKGENTDGAADINAREVQKESNHF